MNAQVDQTMSTYASVDLSYDGSNWTPSSSFNFQNNAQVSITGGGGVALECGLSARVDWLFADVGGPYLGLRAA